MPESRIIEEIPCPECGGVGGPGTCDGPGGSRRLLVRTQPDYTVAARELGDNEGNTWWVLTVLVDGPGDYDISLAGGWLVKEEG